MSEILCTSTGCGKPLDDPVHHGHDGCRCEIDNHEPHCHYVGAPTLADIVAEIDGAA